MKKTTTPAATEPMGIVITLGNRLPVEPRVRAYVWGDVIQEPAPAAHAEKVQAA